MDDIVEISLDNLMELVKVNREVVQELSRQMKYAREQRNSLLSELHRRGLTVSKDFFDREE